MTGRRRVLLAAVVLLLLAVAWLALRPGPALPAGLPRALVFVSDRDGTPALYWRPLPGDRERRLTFGSEAVGEPAVSPDGTRVAFSMNGRIGLVSVAGGDVAILTLGVDWEDAQPAWLPDGRRLVVSARRRSGEPAGLHLLDPAPDGSVGRHPLTEPRAGDDESPAASPDGRIVCAWSEGKRHGVDAIDAEGRERTPLGEGGAFHRTIAPTPDGRFLAATLTWDAGFHPLDALLGAQKEEVVLLDATGGRIARLEASRRHANHSPAWGR